MEELGLQDATGLFLKVEKELQRDMEDSARLENHPLDDDFERVLSDESVLSDEQTSTQQAELESVLKSYRLEPQALKDVLIQEQERSYTLQFEVEAAAGEVSRLRRSKGTIIEKCTVVNLFVGMQRVLSEMLR